MKKIMLIMAICFLSFLFFFVSVGLKAQINLVFNGGFELYDSCPNYFSQIDKAIGWWGARPTCDYFNVCAPYFPHPNPCVAVPLNSFGYRTPASGNAYSGIIAKSGSIEDRECIGSQLITPLQIGNKYFASFKVSLGGEANHNNYCGINKLGILFSTVNYNSSSPAPICSNCAQIYSNSIITDTLNWTRITGSFIADSNYNYISIGRFNINSLTDSIQIIGTQCIAYYYIDDVCLSTDSLFAYSYTYTGIEENSIQPTISVYPNPAKNELRINASTSSATNNQQLTTIKMYNVLGECVYQSAIQQLNNTTINIEDFPKGVYFIEVIANPSTSSGYNNVIRKKFVKE